MDDKKKWEELVETHYNSLKPYSENISLSKENAHELLSKMSNGEADDKEVIECCRYIAYSRDMLSSDAVDYELILQCIDIFKLNVGAPQHEELFDTMQKSLCIFMVEKCYYMPEFIIAGYAENLFTWANEGYEHVQLYIYELLAEISPEADPYDEPKNAPSKIGMFFSYDDDESPVEYYDLVEYYYYPIFTDIIDYIHYWAMKGSQWAYDLLYGNSQAIPEEFFDGETLWIDWDFLKRCRDSGVDIKDFGNLLDKHERGEEILSPLQKNDCGPKLKNNKHALSTTSVYGCLVMFAIFILLSWCAINFFQFVINEITQILHESC